MGLSATVICVDRCTLSPSFEAKPYIPHEDAPDPTAPNAGKQHDVKVDGGAAFTISQHAGRVHEGALESP